LQQPPENSLQLPRKLVTITLSRNNVRYRIAASICPQAGFHGSESHLSDQALRRIRRGQCFYQPCFGLREFVAYFEESDGKRTPIPMDMDTGLAVYDVFDLHDHRVHKKAVTSLSLYHAVMTQGVITVPPYDSPGVIKGGTLC
jgi:CRISPR-associated protein Cas5d